VHIDDGKSIEHLGTVNAWSRRNAVATAIQAFSIPYVLQTRVIVARRAGLYGWFAQLQDWYQSRQK
jgi:hypothetical protein